MIFVKMFKRKDRQSLNSLIDRTENRKGLIYGCLWSFSVFSRSS